MPHWDNRNVFPQGRHTEAAKARLHLGNVWTLSPWYSFWRHKRCKIERAIESGWDLGPCGRVTVPVEVLLRRKTQMSSAFSSSPLCLCSLSWWADPCPCHPLIPVLLHRGFDDLLPKAQIPNRGSSATTMSRENQCFSEHNTDSVIPCPEPQCRSSLPRKQIRDWGGPRKVQQKHV